MKYAHTDSSNSILGWYTSEIHSVIPSPNVAVEDAVWEQAIAGNHNTVTNQGKTSFVDPKSALDYEEEGRAERGWHLKHNVDPLVSNPLRWDSLPASKKTEWEEYRTALLNVTDQPGFPHNIKWPTKPEGE